jgi:hypothetical protein
MGAPFCGKNGPPGRYDPAVDPAAKAQLKDEWLRNESELQRLQELPVEVEDPAERQRQLDARQDEIEFCLAQRDPA